MVGRIVSDKKTDDNTSLSGVGSSHPFFSYLGRSSCFMTSSLSESSVAASRIFGKVILSVLPSFEKRFCS